MTHAHELSEGLQMALQKAVDFWQATEDPLTLRGPDRQRLKMTLMDARREGATWPQLGECLQVDPAALRSGVGCMPRWGQRPDAMNRGHGAGSGLPKRCSGAGGCGQRHSDGQRHGHGRRHGYGHRHGAGLA